MNDEPALTPGIPRGGLEPALALCARLVERTKELKANWTVPQDPIDRIVLATCARTETTFGVALDLIQQGYSPYALALGRVIVEDCEVAHWLVATRPKNVEQLFNDYWDWQNLRLNGDDDPETVGMTRDRAHELRDSFSWAGAHWTRINPKKRREAIRHWCDDQTRLDTLDHLFSHVDVWSNAMLHHSPWGLGAVISLRATVEEPRFTVGPSWLHSWGALRFSYLGTALVVSLCDATYGSNGSDVFAAFAGDDLTAMHAETKRLFDQERGRAAALAKGN